MAALPELRSASSMSGGSDPREATDTQSAYASRPLTATPAAGHGAMVPPPRDIDVAKIKALAVEVIPGRLYFTSLSHHPTSTERCRFFTIDYDLHYAPYFADFGPLNASMLIRFCRALRDRLNRFVNGEEFFFYSSQTPHMRANAGYLIAGFAVLVLGMQPEAVAEMMERAYPPLLPFRDASYGVATYQLTVSDVARALHKAKALGWIDVDTFDVAEYEHFDQLGNGDWNWIVPGKFIAFSSPLDDVPGREAKAVIPAFRERNVSLVVRLNEKRYERRAFTEVGVRHEELQFPDGSTPPDGIVRRFLDLCEVQKGTVAVHCKAGLGRTGTLIGIFLMKHFGFTSRDAIAWCRVCRPGCVIGPQQQYLDTMQRRLDVAGSVYRRSADRDDAPTDNMFEETLSRTRGPAAAAALEATRASAASASASKTGTGRPGSVRQTGRGSAATAAAESSVKGARAQSPAQRSRPRPLKMIEHLPFDVPGDATKKRVTQLQALVVEGMAADEARADAAASSGRPGAQGSARTAAVRRDARPPTTSTGVTRPVLPPAAATFVGGCAQPDRGLAQAFGAPA